MNFDPKDFRRALGKFPTGVTVITTRDQNGERIGVTASSFNSVSIDPALVLWSIDKGAYSLEAFTEGRHFAVNVLRNDQVELSNRFARRGEDKFAGIEVREGLGNSPLLPGAAAVFECRTWNVYEGGDHFIVVGEVLNYSYEDNASSLVFHNGHYAVPEVHPAAKSPTESLLARGFLGDYLLYLLRQSLTAYREDFYPRLGHFGITAEEWRVLTLLADGGTQEAREIAGQVSQPVEALLETGEWLQDKGLIRIDGERLELTGKGMGVTDQLLDMAIEHERQTLACLSEAQQQALKENLKSLYRALG
ncbi:flavin reductase [Marinobacterium aestuariivivens]|uniref:Flavin reductase n=1 Tax=Marinobacterium aestuariivivens TaxID=1698799 RepID=A0ABW1ZTB5_9GAMM